MTWSFVSLGWREGGLERESAFEGSEREREEREKREREKRERPSFSIFVRSFPSLSFSDSRMRERERERDLSLSLSSLATS